MTLPLNPNKKAKRVGKNKNLSADHAPILPRHTPQKNLKRIQLKTESAKSRMLRALMDPEVFTVRTACEIADIGYKTFYEWKRDDPEFALAVAEAEELATQNLEQRASERAMGIKKQKPSDLLMMFLLNGRRPSVYKRDAKGAPDESASKAPDLSKLSPAVLEKLANMENKSE